MFKLQKAKVQKKKHQKQTYYIILKKKKREKMLRGSIVHRELN